MNPAVIVTWLVLGLILAVLTALLLLMQLRRPKLLVRGWDGNAHMWNPKRVRPAPEIAWITRAGQRCKLKIDGKLVRPSKKLLEYCFDELTGQGFLPTLNPNKDAYLWSAIDYAAASNLIIDRRLNDEDDGPMKYAKWAFYAVVVLGVCGLMAFLISKVAK